MLVHNWLRWAKVPFILHTGEFTVPVHPLQGGREGRGLLLALRLAVAFLFYNGRPMAAASCWYIPFVLNGTSSPPPAPSNSSLSTPSYCFYQRNLYLFILISCSVDLFLLQRGVHPVCAAALPLAPHPHPPCSLCCSGIQNKVKLNRLPCLVYQTRVLILNVRTSRLAEVSQTNQDSIVDTNTFWTTSKEN